MHSCSPFVAAWQQLDGLLGQHQLEALAGHIRIGIGVDQLVKNEFDVMGVGVDLVGLVLFVDDADAPGRARERGAERELWCTASAEKSRSGGAAQ